MTNNAFVIVIPQNGLSETLEATENNESSFKFLLDLARNLLYSSKLFDIVFFYYLLFNLAYQKDPLKSHLWRLPGGAWDVEGNSNKGSGALPLLPESIWRLQMEGSNLSANGGVKSFILTKGTTHNRGKK